MITLINSESKLKGVNKIVFGETTLTKYNEDKLVNTDLIEYGFSALIEKIKYNNNRLLDFFDDTVFNLFNQNPKELSKLEDNYIFPTLSNQEEDNNTSPLNYFYIATVQKKSLIVFNVPENIDKVYIYGELDSQVPDITLEFGPVIENPLTYKEAVQSDEVTSEKTIFMTLSLSESDPTYNSINATYYIWKNSNNSNRNKNKYSLRNDEYFGTRFSASILSRDSDKYIVDRSTGTLLYSTASEDLVEETPILNLKKLQWEGNKTYNPRISYNIGDIVEFGRYKDDLEEIKPYRYISLSNNNINNTPCFSSKWILEEKFSDYLMTKINIITYPEDSASITPEGSININKDSDSLNFQIDYKPGYKLDTESDTGYVFVNFNEEPESDITDNVTGIISKGHCDLTVDKPAISKILSNKQIIFKFRHTEYSLHFNTYINSILENVNKRVEISRDGGSTWVVVPGNSSGSDYGNINNIDSNTLIRVTFLNISAENFLKIDKPIIASGVLGESDNSSKEIELKETEDHLFYFIDNPSFVEKTTYLIKISSILHGIRVTGDLKYFEVERIFVEEQHNKPFRIRFYKAKNYKPNFLVTPKVTVIDETGVVAVLNKAKSYTNENVVITPTNKFTYSKDDVKGIYILDVEKADKDYLIQISCK